MDVFAKFENDPRKNTGVRALTGLLCPAARPVAQQLAHSPACSGDENTPDAIRATR